MSQWCNTINGIPYGLCFYFLTMDKYLEGEYDNLGVIGHCPKVLSMLYAPFFSPSLCTFEKVAYNNTLYEMENKPTFDKGWCYRIQDYSGEREHIGGFKAYKEKPSQPLLRDYHYESRLYNYPFTYKTLDDYFNPSLQIIPHLLENANSTLNDNVYAEQSLGDKCTYKLYVEGYKGDDTGQLEGIISSSVQDLPLSSGAYESYMAQNKNSYQTSVQNSMVRNGMNAIFSLNPRNIVGSAMAVANGVANVMMQEKENQAFQSDLINQPRNMKTLGANVPFSAINGDRWVDINTWELPEIERQKIGDFFALYGYKQNKLMKPNIRNRYYYNYIKTIDAKIKVTGNGIPKAHLEELKEIYNRGTTIWHVDRANVVINDYTYDNKEI